MSGVGKLDFPISLYRINAKTKKWPVRIISHFFHFALANACIECMYLIAFLENVLDSLIKIELLKNVRQLVVHKIMQRMFNMINKNIFLNMQLVYDRCANWKVALV